MYLAAWARMAEPSLAAVERALYEERSIVRILGMRRTVFVVSRELVGVVHAACTEPIARRQRQLLQRLLVEGGVTSDPERWLATAEAATLAALDARGEATAAELGADVPALRAQVRLAVGKPYEGAVAVGTRLLFLLAAEGRLVRGRPRGSWISTQYRWAHLSAWLGAEMEAPPAADAEAELARRYLGAFGPVTELDLRWWAGWTAAQARRALRTIGAVAIGLQDGPGFVLPGDEDPEPPVAPWAALLPALDPTVMGWTRRDWFLGPHAPQVFDRTGNAGPTVWWDGRVVGGWALRPTGEAVHRLFEDVGREAEIALAEVAARLTQVVAGTRVVPRFRTPLEKELSGT